MRILAVKIVPIVSNGVGAYWLTTIMFMFKTVLLHAKMSKLYIVILLYIIKEWVFPQIFTSSVLKHNANNYRSRK